MRRTLLLLGALGVLAGLVAAGGFAAAQRAPALILLNANDRFELPNGKIACHVLRSQASATSHLACYRETAVGSFTALHGTYGVEIGESGLGVVRVGRRAFVYARRETPAVGVAAGSSAAHVFFGGAARLTDKHDRVFVRGTNIVCRPYGNSARSLLCVTLGSDGHVPDGSYMVWISDRGVELAQARSGSPVIVFQRRNP